MGSVVLASQGMADLIQIDADSIKSLFQFNPEWSFMKWQELCTTMTDDQSHLFDGKYLSQNGIVENCKLELIPFTVEGECLYQYIIISDDLDLNNDVTLSAPNTDVKIDAAEPVTSHDDYNFSYDDYAPNPIIYFDGSGLVTYMNSKMTIHKDVKIGSDFVENMFLESELGPLMDALTNYPDTEKELLVRMILKGKSKMVDGYGRISFYEEDKAPGIYRLEFLLTEGMQLVDQPLESAMAELDRLRNEVRDTQASLLDEQMDDFSLENIITKSPKYKAVLRQVAQVADTDTTVLITGETGTGKELLCNALYKLSDRSDKIIIKVNCASIPHELFESILFGHEKGSFTGADSQKIGKFELANGGTIFLDELGEMPLDLQSKLLRVLQEGEIERIGNPTPINVDVRVIAATNRDLEKMSKDGTFRSDLYYRVNVFPIYNIPLSDRLEDVPLLISHFIEKVNKKTGKSVTRIRTKDLETLKKYSFPGNVRELENIIERAIILATNDELQMDFFYNVSKEQGSGSSRFSSYEEMIKNHLIRALEYANGKVTGEESASELLGLNGKTLASKLRKYEIDPRDYKTK
jgi:transcriptional regulator with PAS, ATPase and Fis domain